ncbi:sensor histidine kinase [Anaerosporobacter faecicola]|uniref:sensor histidine kinase n=1 Tax=Anaerosporobacter faecicola TaxID=2718714 RepID=UPI001438FBB9|nr:HAMP domain-containing sensor histidine kinase [Anaerosporobacter faecicola]
MRNLELIKMCVRGVLYTMIILLLTYYFPKEQFLWIGLLSVSILSDVLIFTKARYRKISQLSDYLCRIYMGEYSLDVRDYEEGELSVLKSEIYKLTLRMVEQNELLIKDKRYLADALSDISHQLKTPLTSISVMADLLESDQLEEDKRLDFARNIHTQVERMRWLVISLLKLSKLDANAIEFKQEIISLKELVKESLKPFQIISELKNIEVKVGGDDYAECKGDFSWLLEAISNIIKNCFEHTNTNGHIEINYVQNALYLQITIIDNGEGIDEEDLPHLFERFYKGKNANPDSIGIGLALAKQIIIGHNGSIHVISEKGVGTRFIIKLYKVTEMSPKMSS